MGSAVQGGNWKVFVPGGSREESGVPSTSHPEVRLEVFKRGEISWSKTLAREQMREGAGREFHLARSECCLWECM